MLRTYIVNLIAFVLASSCLGLAADDSLTVRTQKWLNLVRELTPQVKESQQDYANAMSVAVLADSGKHAEARAPAMQEDGDKRWSRLTNVVMALVYKSDFENALLISREISDPKWKVRATHYVAIAFARQGNLERAESLIVDMVDDNYKDRVVSEICQYLSRNGKFDDAVAQSHRIKDPARKAETTKLINKPREVNPSPLDQLNGSLHDHIATLTAFSSDGSYDSAISAIVAAKAGDRAQAKKHLADCIGDTNALEIPPRKTTTLILASVALVELGESKVAGDIIEKLYERAGKDWSGVTTTFGRPILFSLLVRLDRRDAIDAILAKGKKNYEADPTDFSYPSTLQTLATSLVEEGRLTEVDSRLESLKTPDEKLFLVLGAITGAEYIRKSKQ